MKPMEDKNPETVTQGAEIVIPNVSASISADVHAQIRNQTDASVEPSLERFTKSLEIAYEQVLVNGEFSLVELPFTDEEIELFTKLLIEKEIDKNFFGSSDGSKEWVMGILKGFTNDEALLEKASTKISKILEATLSVFKKDSAWLCIRSMIGTTEGKPPRWHRDGRFYDRESDEQQMKLAFCLCGQSTPFARLTSAERLAFMEAEKADTKQAELNKLVPEKSIVTPKTGMQGGLFAVGSKVSALHTEPPMTESRIFVSLVPGSASEIAELQERWKHKD